MNPIEDARALAKFGNELGWELKEVVAAIGRDEDLTVSGRAKKVAIESAKMVKPFARRAAELDGLLSRETAAAETKIAERIRDAANMTAAEAAEWRGVLRGLPADERSALVRSAAKGEAAASTQIVGAIVTASSPLLVGIDPAHPLLKVARIAAEEMHAPAESARLAETEAARQGLRRERDKLLGLAGEHGGAVDNHGKRISSLSRDEIVERVKARPDLPFADAIGEPTR